MFYDICLWLSIRLTMVCCTLRFRDMSNLNKLDFTALEVSGRNYLKWVQDVKLYLTGKSLRATIEEPIVEKDPRTLWLALADRFDHQKVIYLPEASHDLQHLRFQDFKSVNEYNLKFVESDHCLSSVTWT